jgi:predicted porin
MKKTLLAIALLSTLPLAAHAQSNVTIYGVADVSINSEDADAPGVGRRTAITSGNQSTSRLGFRGTEDLGNGLKALFNIEAGVALDTGAADTAGLFQRRAVVGLQGSFGTVTVGREYSPVAIVILASDPLGHGFYGSSLAGFGAGRATRRLSNSVNYKSEAISGFSALAAYSAGERTPSDPSGNLVGGGLEYRNGPVYLGAAYHQVERLSIGDDKEMGFGAGYTFGNFELRGSYMRTDLIGPNNAYKHFIVGGAYTMGANKFFLSAHEQRQDAGNGRGKGFTAAYSYTLSKRTNLYSTYARVNNNGAGNFGLSSAGGAFNPPATAFGADPSVFNVGVRHSF